MFSVIAFVPSLLEEGTCCGFGGLVCSVRIIHPFPQNVACGVIIVRIKLITRGLLLSNTNAVKKKKKKTAWGNRSDVKVILRATGGAMASKRGK